MEVYIIIIKTAMTVMRHKIVKLRLEKLLELHTIVLMSLTDLKLTFTINDQCFRQNTNL